LQVGEQHCDLLVLAFRGAPRVIGEKPEAVDGHQRRPWWTRRCQARAALAAKARPNGTLMLTAVASRPAHLLKNSIGLERVSLVWNVA